MIFRGKDIIYIVSFFILSGIIASCGTTKSGLVTNNQLQDTLSEEKKFEFKYQFFEANKQYLIGNYDLALKYFHVCLDIDPQSAATNYKIASIFLAQNNFETAQVYAEKAVQLNSDNVWYLYLAGSLYTQNNEYTKAKTVFEKLIEIDDTELDFYLSLADVYLKENNIDGALKIYNRIEGKFGISEVISLQKHKIYIASKRNKEALLELETLANKFPQNVEYKRLIADFYIKTNNIDKAIELYLSILNDNANDGYSRIGLAECYRLKNDIEKSFEQLELAFNAEDVPSDLKFNMLISLIQNSANSPSIQKAAFDLTVILYNKYPKDADIATIYANFLLQEKKLDEARKVLVEVVKDRKDKYAVWEQLILLDNEFTKWEDMFKHTQEALKYFPNQSFLYFFDGFSAFQLEKYNEAVKSLSFGYKLITADDPLRNDFLTFLGESYFKIGDKEQAYSYFNDIINNQPDNIMVLNNYAYYLSEDELDLEKAEKMSKITITKEPKNSTYLDTYAWILFKMSKYDEALIYIERAIENDSDASDVVLEHYGDILFHTNKIDEAVIQWKKAIIKGSGSGLLEKKIEEKKYIK